MGNNPAAEAREGAPQTLSEEVLEKLREIFAWLQRDARDQFKDYNTRKFHHNKILLATWFSFIF
jgi:hypothetical protein